jgi:hypothetical protein
MVLEDLVQLILKREMEEMLRDDSADMDGSFNGTVPHRDGMEGVQIGDDAQIASQGGAYSASVDTSGGHNADGSHFTQSLLTLQRGIACPTMKPKSMTLTFISSLPGQQCYATSN